MPSESVGVAVVGSGYWGPKLVRNFDGLDKCQVRWVCDKMPGRLQYIAERHPQIPLTDDFDQVLADPRVDAVVLATPVSTHYTLAMAALAAGKDVFVEKPLADTSARAVEIVSVADRAKRILAVGHVFVYHPAISYMRDLLQMGQLGTLCYAETSRINLGPPKSEVNVIWDLAVHDLSILLFLRDQLPVEITAYGNRYVHPTLTDVAFLMVRFEDGSITEHHVSWLSAERVRRVFVAGTEGSLMFDDTLERGKLRHVDQGEDSRIGLSDSDSKELFYRPGQVRIPQIGTNEPLRLECEHFIECVRMRKSPRADGRCGAVVVRLLEGANESIAQGSMPVQLTWDGIPPGDH